MVKKADEGALSHPRYWPSWVGIGIWWSIAQLPYPVIRLLSRAIGSALALVGTRRQKIAEINVALCFPELSTSQQRDFVRRHLQSFVLGAFETGLSWWWSGRRFQKVFEIEGLHHLTNLNGQGALLLAFHFTHLDIGAVALTSKFVVDGVYKPQKNRVMEHVIQRGRLNKRKRSTETGKIEETQLFETKDTRGIIKALRRGRVIWYAPDQDFGPDRSLFVPFFNVPAATLTATSKLAKAGHAKVIPMYQQRTENGHIKVTILPPLEDFPTDSEMQDALKISQLNEEIVRLMPEDYLWVHRRFKSRPDGQPSPYTR